MRNKSSQLHSLSLGRAAVGMMIRFIFCVILINGYLLGVANSDGNNHQSQVVRLESANVVHLSPYNMMVVPSDVVVVELNIYAGREDPYIQLPRAQIHRMLQSSFGWRNPGISTGLGYQGFSIYNYQRGPLLIGCGSDIGVETGLLDRLGLGIDRELRHYVQSQIQFSSHQRHHPHQHPQHGIPPHGFGCRPPPSTSKFEPHVWNNRTFVRRRNNCYNYANNIITNSFGQPGRANRHNITRNPVNLYGQSVFYGTQLDGLTPVPAHTQCLPNAGLNLVALVIWPGRDYHFYRLDNNGLFSHKPGRTAARNVDNSNNLILDPRTCDRGPYRVFQGFFTTNVFDVRHIM